MSADGRKYKRIRSDFNVRAIITDSGQGLRAVMTTGKTKNVSATGVLFDSDMAFDIGMIINVKFLKPNSFDFFEGNAKVVRVEIQPEDDGYEIGVQFINLTSEDEQKLNYYISQEEE